MKTAPSCLSDASKLFLLAIFAIAVCGSWLTGPASAAPQSTCPVMGGAINPELYADVAGKRVYVCCGGCIGMIEKDPAKYLAILEGRGEEVEALPETVPAGKVQTICPVMGGAVNPKLYADVDGKRIYVCCGGCIDAIRKDPAKYISILEADGVAIEKAPAAESLGTESGVAPPDTK